MSTHNIFFLWRTGEMYLRMIANYFALTSYLLMENREVSPPDVAHSSFEHICKDIIVQHGNLFGYCLLTGSHLIAVFKNHISVILPKFGLYVKDLLWSISPDSESSHLHCLDHHVQKTLTGNLTRSWLMLALSRQTILYLYRLDRLPYASATIWTRLLIQIVFSPA